LDELPVRDVLQFFGACRSRLSLHEQLKLLLVTGGIPRYLEEIDPKQTAEDNIERLCFSQGGLYLSEYDQLMNRIPTPQSLQNLDSPSRVSGRRQFVVAASIAQ
jgi:hypothetical protein